MGGLKERGCLTESVKRASMMYQDPILWACLEFFFRGINSETKSNDWVPYSDNNGDKQRLARQYTNKSTSP